ncbi:MAG: hypothetical protein HYR76_05010 [Ignavibacteria bacterium]|nr:hypothetical protein [Ignavibacteria bacterium]
MGILIILLSGCYTQLSTVKEDREDEEQYAPSGDRGDSSYTRNEDEEGEYRNRSDYGYDDYSWQYRPRIGFSYYYQPWWPSYAFSVAYASPWCYDNFWAYDPWYCGTPYIRYPFYGYSPAYYYPAYYYPSFYSHYGYPRAYSSLRRGTRDFGSTRGSGGGRGTPAGYDLPNTDRGNYNLPTGASLGRGANGASPNRNSPSVKDNSRQLGSQRTYVPRNDGRARVRMNETVRGSGSRGGDARGSRRGDASPQVSRPQESSGASSAPVYRPPGRSTGGSHEHNRGNRDTGSTRSGGSTYSPPPAPAPHSSPPPPSSSWSPQSSGGSRGGGSRGGRP